MTSSGSAGTRERANQDVVTQIVTLLYRQNLGEDATIQQ